VNTPGLAGLVEVEPMAHHDVEQVVWGQTAVQRRLDVIAGNEPSAEVQ
jgi:hypothetical protein